MTRIPKAKAASRCFTRVSERDRSIPGLAMERIRTLIVDDEKPARRRLAELLGREPEIEVTGEARDGREAVDLVQAQTPDLMFLDIQMPDLDGFGVLAALEPSQQPVTVFVTA